MLTQKLSAPARLLLFLLLAACSGSPNPPGGGDDNGTVDIPPPNPLDVSITLDEAQAASEAIALSGGSLSITAEDGAVYTLTVPENALLEATEITMTPILSIEDSPVTGGRLLGVELKPHGLRLYDFATLTITPPGGGTGKAIAFTAQDGGKEFHLYPLELDPSKISLKLMHFSEYGAYVRGENDPIPVRDPEVSNTITIEIMPFDWEAQLEQLMEELMRKEREAQLRGEEGDPQFEEKLEAILNAYYDEVIKPMLGKIGTDCAYAEANSSKVLGWSRNVSVLGLDETFAAQTGAVTDAVLKGADNCWQKTIAPCIDPNNEVQVSEANRHARLNQILGGDPEKYNPNNPELQCEEGCAWVKDIPYKDGAEWTGSLSFLYQNAASSEDSSVGVYHSGDVIFQAQGGLTAEGKYRFTDIDVNGTLVTDNYITWVYHDREVVDTEYGSGPPTHPSVMEMTLDLTACTFDLEIMLNYEVTVTKPNIGVIGTGKNSFYLDVFSLPFPESPASYTLTAELPVYGHSHWDAEEGTNHVSFGSIGMDRLDGFLGKNLGTAAVSWSFAPVP